MANGQVEAKPQLIYLQARHRGTSRALHCAMARLKRWFSFIINQINMGRPRHWQAQYGSQAGRQASERQATQATAQCSHLPQMVIDVHAVPVLVRCPGSSVCLPWVPCGHPLPSSSSPLSRLSLSLSSLQTLQVYRIAVCRASRGVYAILANEFLCVLRRFG